MEAVAVLIRHPTCGRQGYSGVVTYCREGTVVAAQDGIGKGERFDSEGRIIMNDFGRESSFSLASDPHSVWRVDTLPSDYWSKASSCCTTFIFQTVERLPVCALMMMVCELSYSMNETSSRAHTASGKREARIQIRLLQSISEQVSRIAHRGTAHRYRGRCQHCISGN